MKKSSILVLGLGNLLMGDEGVGVHTARMLDQGRLPQAITIVDGGTGGFHLLSYLQDFATVVMIDATMDGKPPGTLSLIRPRFATDFPRTLSAHDIGLRDLIESAFLLGPLPEIYLITVSISGIQTMSLQLSPPVAAAVPLAAAQVQGIVNTILDH